MKLKEKLKEMHKVQAMSLNYHNMIKVLKILRQRRKDKDKMIY